MGHVQQHMKQLILSLAITLLAFNALANQQVIRTDPNDGTTTSISIPDEYTHVFNPPLPAASACPIALCWPATASIALRGDGLLREVLLISSIPTGSVAVTTFTFENNSGGTLAAGTPVQMGQAFRYGDIPSGYHPVIRDAVTHVALAHQQFDEIDTWRENGGNGSWRHAVWIIDLPSDLANGATYQVEFVPTSGSYSQSPVLALSALCSGVNTHDLKVHLTDLRNQDDTVRGTGEATFRLCDNIANIGRDAPRTLDQGSVRSTFKVVGRFQYYRLVL